MKTYLTKQAALHAAGRLTAPVVHVIFGRVDEPNGNHHYGYHVSPHRARVHVWESEVALYHDGRRVYGVSR